MLNQPQQFQLNTCEVTFDPASAPVAPRPRKVVEPKAQVFKAVEEPAAVTPLRLAIEVVGNVVVGGALLAGLLAAPGILGQLAGLI